MNRLPGEKPIPNKNRSAKHLYRLTRSGLRHMQNWMKKCGIPEYRPEYHKAKTTQSPKKKDADDSVKAEEPKLAASIDEIA